MGKCIPIALATLLALAAGCAAPPTVAPAPLSRSAGALSISSPTAEDQGLSAVSVVDTTSGATFRVVFDATSESAARHSIPALAGFHRSIAELVAVDPATVPWSDVLFARNAGDLLLERKQDQVLWRIEVAADGHLDAGALQMLYGTIPHEQVHATQQGLPRWYAEGQAEWAGLQVTRETMPDMAREMRGQLDQALASSTEPLSLAAWGGIQPKIEAILRQLAPAQRAQFLKDPGSVPLRALSFGPDDLVSDESNTRARYAGALALFERIDEAAGRQALHEWFRAVRALGDHPDTRRIVDLAREMTGEDIGPALQ